MAAAAAEDAAVPSPPPSLLSLCLEAVASHLTAGAGGVGQAGGRWGRDHFDGGEGGGDTMITPEEVAEALPWELLHRLASLLPPAALESLHHAAHDRYPTMLPTSSLYSAMDVLFLLRDDSSAPSPCLNLSTYYYDL